MISEVGSLVLAVLTSVAESLGRPVGYALDGTPPTAYPLTEWGVGNAYVQVEPGGARGQHRHVELGAVSNPRFGAERVAGWDYHDMLRLWAADPEAAANVEYAAVATGDRRVIERLVVDHPGIVVTRQCWADHRDARRARRAMYYHEDRGPVPPEGDRRAGIAP